MPLLGLSTCQTIARLGLFIGSGNDKYLKKSFFHLTRVEWFTGLAGLGQHGHNVIVPKHPIGRVDLGNVAKQPFRVNFRQD